MGEKTDGYTAEITIFDERNGEIVKVLRNIEIEEKAWSEEALELIEDFPSLAISKYEEEAYV